MNLMVHTLKKDARRLWPAAASTWVLLALLAREDRWRADWVPSQMEGWMNPLLTAAWACLAALAVLEEPLVGESNFWTTRPHRWPALLAAKLAFAVLAIDLPSLVADIFVLALHGFSPASYGGDLVWKQAVFFGCVILPAMAVASLVRSFQQFVIVLFIVGAALSSLSGGLHRYPDYSRQPTALRDSLVAAILVGSAIAVVCMQYARRGVVPARVIGALGALAAATVWTYLPVRAEYSVGGAGGRETPHLSLRSATPTEDVIRSAPRPTQRTVLLPITIGAISQRSLFHLTHVEVEIDARDGGPIQSGQPSPNRPFEKIDLTAYAYSARRGVAPDWLVLSFGEAAWTRAGNTRVRVRGSAAFAFYHRGSTAGAPTEGSASVPGVGRCSVLTVDGRFSEQMLKLICESPRALPATEVLLRHEPTGRVWPAGLNTATSYFPWPNRTWLSPLHRGQAFFNLAPAATTAPGAQWLVPVNDLPSARIEITPEVVTGHALSYFDFADVRMSSPSVTR